MGGFSGTANNVQTIGLKNTIVSHTGTTAETVLFTVNVPALDINSLLKMSSLFSYTNSVNYKYLRIRLGGIGGQVVMLYNALTTATFTDINRAVLNRGATNSQVCTNSQVTVGPSTGAINALTVDTSVATTLVFTVQLASAAETASLEYAHVTLER